LYEYQQKERYFIEMANMTPRVINCACKVFTPSPLDFLVLPEVMSKSMITDTNPIER